MEYNSSYLSGGKISNHFRNNWMPRCGDIIIFGPIGLSWIHPTGTSFILSDGDGKNVTVEMTDPLDEELSGIIEVVGKVTHKATIKAVYYAPFREDKNSFDLSLYNEALHILHEFPQYYPFSVTSSS
uniref:replication protein A 14 kDa subunit isoform X1 n=1 Tax=Pristiophorus japonicus TaxID=55135 RepID=UPI00398EBB65